MKINFKRTLLCGLLLLFATPTLANDLNFSLGGGYPFVAVPEVSIINTEQHSRWHVNYKVGLDDGFSLGFEQAISENNKHAVGVFLGAIGVHEEDSPCSDQAQAIDCLIGNLFDEEVTNGLGLSYAYYFSAINNDGWHVKLEAGYGEGQKSETRRNDASIRISYQF